METTIVYWGHIGIVENGDYNFTSIAITSSYTIIKQEQDHRHSGFCSDTTAAVVVLLIVSLDCWDCKKPLSWLRGTRYHCCSAWRISHGHFFILTAEITSKPLAAGPKFERLL